MEVQVAEPMHNFHSCHHGHLFMHGPLGGDRSGWEKKLTGVPRMGHPVHLIIKILLCWVHPLVSNHMGHKYLRIPPPPFKDVYLHSLPQAFLFPVFQSCSFQVPDHPNKPLAAAYDLVYNHTFGHFSLQAK